MQSPDISGGYVPISCSAYDVLESSAVLRHDLELWLMDGSTIRGKVLDVFAKGKEEFCTLTTSSGQSPDTIRLDQIVRIVDITDNKSYTTNTC